MFGSTFNKTGKDEEVHNPAKFENPFDCVRSRLLGVQGADVSQMFGLVTACLQVAAGLILFAWPEWQL